MAQILQNLGEISEILYIYINVYIYIYLITLLIPFIIPWFVSAVLYSLYIVQVFYWFVSAVLYSLYIVQVFIGLYLLYCIHCIFYRYFISKGFISITRGSFSSFYKLHRRYSAILCCSFKYMNILHIYIHDHICRLFLQWHICRGPYV